MKACYFANSRQSEKERVRKVQLTNYSHFNECVSISKSVKRGLLLIEVMASFATALLYLQLLLACWQIVRLTPLGLLLRAIALRLQTIFLAAVGIKLNTGYCIPQFSYAGPFLKTTLRAKHYYKEPTLATLRADGVHDLQVSKAYDNEQYTFEWHNYKCTFKLERQNFGLSLHTKIDNKASSYYITREQYWRRVMHIFSNPMLVVVKKKRGFLGSTLTGEILSPEEILDEVLLRSCWLLSDRGWLLPVVASEEETKLLASLNLVGVYGQVKQWSSLFISIWTLIVTLLQFSDWARQNLYRLLNKGAVALLQRIIDQLPVRHRRFLYSLGTFWDDLAPCNDCEARVVRGEKVELYSVSNVKYNDLTFKQLIAGIDEAEMNFQNELISGHIYEHACSIQWGHLSNTTGFRPNSPYRAMLKAMVEHKSGAVYSKQGRRVKVWSLVDTFNRLNMDPTAKVLIWEGCNVVVK